MKHLGPQKKAPCLVRLGENDGFSSELPSIIGSWSVVFGLRTVPLLVRRGERGRWTATTASMDFGELAGTRVSLVLEVQAIICSRS